MPSASGADTIRILVATDNHVGYAERDPIRGNDSWDTFHEIMELARDQDVDMVLLAGDLFHDNKPSRRAMYEVMRSLRMVCFGDKPCELELLSDATENFQGAFNHVNYEDPDINVAIPVFSIHGNHDDPSGEGHLAALDLLQVAGLLNYYGRTPESDNIVIKPVLLQKGHTKLALYGMSNVRDERLFRTFRDGHVKFFQPGVQKDEWFNLMSVHQNHHAHTQTSYLPENFLPEFLDLVIWGHEHECLIEPRYNPEMSFHVMQPGSSIATSLMPGEAVEKRVAILKITGKDFEYEAIPLKTVRPFIMREIVLAEEKEMKNVWKKDDNRPTITRHLMSIVKEMIAEAKQNWDEANHDNHDDEGDRKEPPLPLIRLRVEYSAPDGGRFDCENPQRLSNRFRGSVANTNDVVQFYRKKHATRKVNGANVEMPEASALAQVTLDSVRVDKLVKEFLTAQSLTILPQNSFGDAVSQFVDKDDRHAMEMFVNESLASQVKHLLHDEEVDDDEVQQAMDLYRSKLEELFAAGQIKRSTTRRFKPKPDGWDSDLDGAWEDQPGALIHMDNEAENYDEDEDGDLGSIPVKPAAARGRGRGRGSRVTAASTRGTTITATKAASTRGGRGKKQIIEESEDDEDSDIMMIDDEAEDNGIDVDDSQSQSQLFVKASTKPAARPPAGKAPASRAKSTQIKVPAKAPTRQAQAQKQSTLDFSQSQAVPPRSSTTSRAAATRRQPIAISEDEISDDDDDAFEPPPPTARSTRTRR